MIEAINFVKGAASKAGDVPAYSHFCISDGYIKSTNGVVTLASPIDLDMEIKPKADLFAKAINARKTALSMHVTPKGKLAVIYGNLKVFIPCTDEPFPTNAPEGERMIAPTGFVDALRLLAPFVSKDNHHTWATGILFKGLSLFATSNIVVVQKFVGGKEVKDAVIIPIPAVKEILRIKEEPEEILTSKNSATFLYSGGRWLKTQLITGDWPCMDGFLDGLDNAANTQAIEDATFFSALKELIPFTDSSSRVFLHPSRISTTAEKDEGAIIEVSVTGGQGIYNARALLSIEKIAEEIDLSKYPKPAFFKGNSLRGAISGMRL